MDENQDFMSGQTILMMDSGHPGQLKALQDCFEVVRLKKPDPDAIIRKYQNDIRAIVTVLTPVTANLIEALPNLEIICVGAVGVDHVDLDLANSRDIRVTNTPDVLTDDTADTGIFLMLACMRKGVEGDAFVRAGVWQPGSKLPYGTTPVGKTMGIVGLGRIGKAVAERAKAFKMNIVYHGRHEQADQPYQYYPDLKEMAAASDVLMLTCPGGEGTSHIINHEVLEALGPSGFVINIARGSVIHTQDLLVALTNKSIAGAGLDVYEKEPYVPPELIPMDNVVLLPHIGSDTVETRTKMGALVVENLLAHFGGQPLITAVEII